MPISANELRIGNWVYYGKSIRPITLIANSPQRKAVGVDDMITELEILNPIPLTPEILEKAGFEVENEYWIYEGFKLWTSAENELQSKCGFYHINSELLIHIDHLHQLQNLYFALTGEELVITGL